MERKRDPGTGACVTDTSTLAGRRALRPGSSPGGGHGALPAVLGTEEAPVGDRRAWVLVHTAQAASP